MDRRYMASPETRAFYWHLVVARGLIPARTHFLQNRFVSLWEVRNPEALVDCSDIFNPASATLLAPPSPAPATPAPRAAAPVALAPRTATPVALAPRAAAVAIVGHTLDPGTTCHACKKKKTGNKTCELCGLKICAKCLIRDAHDASGSVLKRCPVCMNTCPCAKCSRLKKGQNQFVTSCSRPPSETFTMRDAVPSSSQSSSSLSSTASFPSRLRPRRNIKLPARFVDTSKVNYVENGTVLPTRIIEYPHPGKTGSRFSTKRRRIVLKLTPTASSHQKLIAPPKMLPNPSKPLPPPPYNPAKPLPTLPRQLPPPPSLLTSLSQGRLAALPAQLGMKRTWSSVHAEESPSRPNQGVRISSGPTAGISSAFPGSPSPDSASPDSGSPHSSSSSTHRTNPSPQKPKNVLKSPVRESNNNHQA